MAHSAAYKALPAKRQSFVNAILDLGMVNHTRAAMTAGYGNGNPNAAKVRAHELFHDPRVKAAIFEEAKLRLDMASPMAISMLIQIAQDTADEKVKLKALEMILNRTGFHALSEHKVDVTHTLDDSQAIERIRQLAKVLHLDETKLLGSITQREPAPEPLDVEFEDVPDFDAAAFDVEEDNG